MPRPQFPLRSLFIITAIVAVAISWPRCAPRWGMAYISPIEGGRVRVEWGSGRRENMSESEARKAFGFYFKGPVYFMPKDALHRPNRPPKD